MSGATNEHEHGSRSRRLLRSRRGRRGLIGGVLAAAVFVVSIVGALGAWNSAGTYFQRAAWIANCYPAVKPPTSQAECARLARSPARIGDAVLTDEALTLSYASTLHSTGTAAMTLGGIVVSLTIGLTSLVVASTKDDD